MSSIGGVASAAGGFSAHSSAAPKNPRTPWVGGVRTGMAGLAHHVGAIRIPDFILFFLLASIGGVTTLPFQPTAIIIGLAVALAATRRPRFQLGRMATWIPITMLMLMYVGLVSLYFPPEPGASDWRGRLLRIGVTCIFMFCIASGRLDLRSGIFGYATAMIVNIPLFYAHLLPNTYGGYLTGWFGDKNVAGMVYCLFGLMLLWGARTRLMHIVIFVGIAVPLWLTGSRTSLAAYVAAVIWMLLAPRIPLVARWMLGLLIWYGVFVLATKFSQIGAFADRSGTDALRSRIDAGSWAKVQSSGFFGRGLGSAFVDLGNQGTWFFHSSFWTALVEGGWPWTIFLVGITVLVMVRPFTARVTREQAIAQGLGIAVLICASQLGEVFGTEEWAIAMAFAMQMWVRARDAGSPPADVGAAPSLDAAAS